MLIERTLSPFNVAERVKIASAPEVRISEDTAVALALILNELATNALKYGSVSTAHGSVSIECEQLHYKNMTVLQCFSVVERAGSKRNFMRKIHSALNAVCQQQAPAERVALGCGSREIICPACW